MTSLVLALMLHSKKPYVVCIDPGHPSEVGRGTTGKQISELKAVWLVAKQLQKRLEARSITVVLTKSSEQEFVRNKRRAEIANNSKADLFIRLHCDAAAGRGLATYYPDKQGRSGGVTGPKPEVLKRSSIAAHAFHPEAIRVLKGSIPDFGLFTDRKTLVGGKQGALTGSIWSKVPVLLVEMVVLTNPKDEAFIVTTKGQDKMAEALDAGVMKALSALDNATAASLQTVHSAVGSRARRSE